MADTEILAIIAVSTRGMTDVPCGSPSARLQGQVLLREPAFLRKVAPGSSQRPLAKEIFKAQRHAIHPRPKQEVDRVKTGASRGARPPDCLLHLKQGYYPSADVAYLGLRYATVSRIV